MYSVVHYGTLVFHINWVVIVGCDLLTFWYSLFPRGATNTFAKSTKTI
jgi:hypothetical protein